MGGRESDILLHAWLSESRYLNSSAGLISVLPISVGFDFSGRADRINPLLLEGSRVRKS